MFLPTGSFTGMPNHVHFHPKIFLSWTISNLSENLPQSQNNGKTDTMALVVRGDALSSTQHHPGAQQVRWHLLMTLQSAAVLVRASDLEYSGASRRIQRAETYQLACPKVISICWFNLPNLLVSSTGRA